MTPQNLIRARFKNVMGISHVEISPTGNITQIVGPNDNSKTTILEAIKTTFEGTTDGSIVKHGEGEAEFFVEIPGYSIRRIIKPDGKQTLTVRDDNDFKVPSPQEFINTIIDRSGFNPMECLEPKKRNDAILKAIDLKVTSEIIASRIKVDIESLPKFDYTKHGLKVIDEAYAYYDKRRTEVNRDAKLKHDKWKAYEADFKPVAPPENTRETIKEERQKVSERIVSAKVSIGGIEAIEFSNNSINAKLEKYNSEFETYKNQKVMKVKNLEIDIDLLTKQIEQKRVEINHTEQLFIQKSADVQKYFEETQKGLQPVIDKSAYTIELQNCETFNAVLDGAEKELDAYDATLQTQKMIKDLENEWQLSQEYANKTEEQAKLLQNKFKKELMSTVEMPIDGLEYVDGTFLVKGTQIDRLCKSKSLILGVNIARKLAKKIKLILADGVEQLDAETQEVFYKTIENDGFTYIFASCAPPSPNYPSITMNKGIVQ